MKKIDKLLLFLYVKYKKRTTQSSRTIVDFRELKARAVAIKLINEPDSILRICPKTFKRFIVNKRLKVSIIINQSSIDFFDDHLHSVNFCEKNFHYIVDLFDEVASKDRELLEQRIKASVQHSFFDLYEKVFN